VTPLTDSREFSHILVQIVIAGTVLKTSACSFEIELPAM
jgi:hypothetical protein